MGWENAASTTSCLTAAVAAAILTAATTPFFPLGSPPLFEHLICWLLVFAVVGFPSPANSKIWKRHSISSTTPLDSLYWTVASALTLTAASSCFVDTKWVTPLVAYALLARRPTWLLTHLHRLLPGYISYTWFVAAVGIVIFASLVPDLDAKSLVPAALTAIGLTETYTALIRISGRDHDYIDGREPLIIRNFVSTIAFRTNSLILLPTTLMIIIWPGSPLDMTGAALAGSLKAAHWIIIFWLTQEMPWEIALTIEAFVAASTGSLYPTVPGLLSVSRAAIRTVVSVSSLYQTMDFLPKNEKGRILLAIFALWPVSSFVQHVPLGVHRVPLPGISWYQPPEPSPYHPVELLVRKAQEDFKRLIDQQSKTLQSAETEYRRRYSRDPPPGFDKWFSYAKSKNSVLIDDFDMINEDLKPFWNVSPQHLHESIDYVSGLDHLALRKCGFTNGQYHWQGDDWIVESFGKLLEEVSQNIPNVEFAFNVVDEPRVVITQQMLDAGGVSKPEFHNTHHLPIWDRTTSPCAHVDSVKEVASNHPYGLPLVQDWRQAKDVCSHPEFGLMHGFFSSPTTSLLTDAPIPVLSQAAPTSFGDIMYPSPWYTEKSKQGVYKDKEDPPWEQKAKNLYWAGSTTGSYSWNGTWQHSHRQRFIKLVQTLNHTEHTYVKESKLGHWTSYKASEDHSNLFDVKFTAVIQCDDKDCEEQKRFFTFGEKENRSRQFYSQFVFDIDGNSFSGRFYTLLRSRSVVLKQTVLREWHDERLVPWVHFIPISMSMDELPEIMRYMTSHEDGKRRAKEIAEAGREWHDKVLRPEDFTVYLYRLMLELARIMDPNRHVEK